MTAEQRQASEIIINNLYKRFGTDSGILFGIKEREVVKTIVEETIKQLAEWQSSQPTVEQCNHEALTDTGIGYYHCPTCNQGWTYKEWKELKEQPIVTSDKMTFAETLKEYKQRQPIDAKPLTDAQIVEPTAIAEGEKEAEIFATQMMGIGEWKEEWNYNDKYMWQTIKRSYMAGQKSKPTLSDREIEQMAEREKLKPKVVCFCGSTRFAEYFMIHRWELEKQGIITLGINILPNNYFVEGNSHGAEQEGVKEILDELHKRKIDLSDEVFVLDVDGYIGESTRNEINYAESIGKPIKYLSKDSKPV